MFGISLHFLMIAAEKLSALDVFFIRNDV